MCLIFLIYMLWSQSAPSLKNVFVRDALEDLSELLLFPIFMAWKEGAGKPYKCPCYFSEFEMQELLSPKLVSFVDSVTVPVSSCNGEWIIIFESGRWCCLHKAGTELRESQKFKFNLNFRSNWDDKVCHMSLWTESNFPFVHWFFFLPQNAGSPNINAAFCSVCSLPP